MTKCVICFNETNPDEFASEISNQNILEQFVVCKTHKVELEKGEQNGKPGNAESATGKEKAWPSGRFEEQTESNQGIRGKTRVKPMNREFPKSDNKFIKSSIFQDQEIPLTFKGWEKKGNEDREFKGQVKSWKQNLKYCLRYSYPEFAVDEAGEKILKDGKPVKNRNFDPEFPHGYTIIYYFEEGQLESGSLPLFQAFCLVRPKAGELITISRTGIDKETKWKVRKAIKEQISASTGELPDLDENQDPEIPF